MVERVGMNEYPSKAREVREVEGGLVKVYTGSEPSEKRKREGDPSQDYSFARSDIGAAGVFDGLGGHAAGEVASAMASEIIEKELALMPAGASREEVKEHVRLSIEKAHRAIVQRGNELLELKGMGTTVVITKVVEIDGVRELIIGWVGDSRAQLYRDGVLSIETLDDAGWLQNIPEEARVMEQKYQARALSADDLPADALVHGLVKDPSVTQFLGADDPWKAEALQNDESVLGLRGTIIAPRELDIHTASIEVQSGDVVLLSTDGLHDVLTLDQIQEVLAEFSYEDAVAELIKRVRAKKRGKSFRAKDDDITVQILVF